MQRQTTIAKKENITRKWYVVDAANKPLGRLASEVAVVLLGKDKPTYTPNVDCGDYVIVINASKVSLSGNNKLKQKFYYNVSGYAGGLRKRSAAVMLKDYPEEMLERSIRGMLPKGRLGRQIGKKLFVYAGAEHKHEAQQPVVKELKF
ncbi:MAG: 50S ribosomal protein L13 [Bacilli bacterium]|nr:50S ribosomal protein L13 [Bacilli bacterium]MCI7621746.1 50S ribosomal protein L13 [Bacilli bacterium]MDD6226868.1 50S ribosomal protein L13 [Bacilli bacterium]MDD7374612.1 50S ribosomal protein L13 [Bacilli bacterium]MDD7548950.1 50S ribosomal protein L13 [Bacilli bacterium]